jgi:hypothetical protein
MEKISIVTILCFVQIFFISASYLEEKIFAKLDSIEVKNKNCIKEKLKSSPELEQLLFYNEFNDEWLREGHKVDRHNSHGAFLSTIRDEKQKIKNILKGAAIDCKSDSTFGGNFNDLFIANTRHFLDVLANARKLFSTIQDEAKDEEACDVKFAISNNFLELSQSKINQKYIDERGLDCETRVELKRHGEDHHFNVSQESMNPSCNENCRNCEWKIYKQLKIFETKLALDLIEKLFLVPSEKTKNENKLNANLRKFRSERLSVCFWGMN